MMRVSYLSPKTEVRESKIHGRGLFATADIAKDEIVAVKGGRIVDRKTLREKITPRLGPVPQVKAAALGSRFDQIGWVSLHGGEPCAPQIMFDFHGIRSMVSLAAPRRETEILTDAAKKNHRVHVLGKWRCGGQSNCSYVEVTSAE
jgi:hypothetical protein